MKKLFVVEARHKDGTLNVKDYEVMFAFKASGVTERFIVEYFFRHTEDTKDIDKSVAHVQTASMETIYKWYNEKGWYIRPKTW
jgi:hypothetical protein